MRNRPAVILDLILVLTLAALAGCGANLPALRATLPPLPLRAAQAANEQDLFRRDGAGSISEEDLRRALEAPTFLKAGARVGVVQVATRYEMDGELPLAAVPGELSHALESSGLCESTTEISTDWPSDRGVSGLRELAARYRTEYLLLYRHRFVDRAYTNAWGWLYPTVVGALVVPSQTLETAGVIEATLFDVRSGTLLFTVFERVGAERTANVWHNDRKVRDLHAALLRRAAERLAAEVVGKARRLAARRPAAVAVPAATAAPSPAAAPAPLPAAAAAPAPVVAPRG
jgi:predicted small lipoprotein YifL